MFKLCSVKAIEPKHLYLRLWISTLIRYHSSPTVSTISIFKNGFVNQPGTLSHNYFQHLAVFNYSGKFSRMFYTVLYYFLWLFSFYHHRLRFLWEGRFCDANTRRDLKTRPPRRKEKELYYCISGNTQSIIDNCRSQQLQKARYMLYTRWNHEYTSADCIIRIKLVPVHFSRCKWTPTHVAHCANLVPILRSPNLVYYIR